MTAARTRVLLVSGMSGAGKSSALKVLEDLGYEAVDNLPLSLLAGLATGATPVVPKGETANALAIGIDTRTRDFVPSRFIQGLRLLRKTSDIEVRFLFLDCDDEVLKSRFVTTRRRHPLATDRPVADGIRGERSLMGSLKARADVLVDTSEMTLPDLRRVLTGHFSLDHAPGLAVTVTSFSYGRGVPRDADLVFDVRFLNNPFYRSRLKALTGMAEAVAAYIIKDKRWAPFFAKLTDFLAFLLPCYAEEGKSYLTIAIGCTGGRHRSVFAAGEVARRLREAGYRVNVRHRDIGGDDG
jgi:UPF0042 nucleotide-binding protein